MRIAPLLAAHLQVPARCGLHQSRDLEIDGLQTFLDACDRIGDARFLAGQLLQLHREITDRIFLHHLDNAHRVSDVRGHQLVHLLGHFPIAAGKLLRIDAMADQTRFMPALHFDLGRNEALELLLHRLH